MVERIRRSAKSRSTEEDYQRGYRAGVDAERIVMADLLKVLAEEITGNPSASLNACVQVVKKLKSASVARGPANSSGLGLDQVE